MDRTPCGGAMAFLFRSQFNPPALANCRKGRMIRKGITRASENENESVRIPSATRSSEA